MVGLHKEAHLACYDCWSVPQGTLASDIDLVCNRYIYVCAICLYIFVVYLCNIYLCNICFLHMCNICLYICAIQSDLS